MRPGFRSLAKKNNRIRHCLSVFLKDCKEEEEVAAAEDQRRNTEQNIKTDPGCKLPKYEDSNNCKDYKEKHEAKSI